LPGLEIQQFTTEIARAIGAGFGHRRAWAWLPHRQHHDDHRDRAGRDKKQRECGTDQAGCQDRDGDADGGQANEDTRIETGTQESHRIVPFRLNEVDASRAISLVRR
jgi:hypothetical protein